MKFKVIVKEEIKIENTKVEPNNEKIPSSTITTTPQNLNKDNLKENLENNSTTTSKCF